MVTVRERSPTSPPPAWYPRGVSGRISRSTGALCWLVLGGCRPQVAETPPPLPQSEPQPQPSVPATEPPPAEPSRCRPATAEPAIAAAAPGPAYALVEHVGVVRIDDGAATTVWALPKGTDARDLEMKAGPNGALWLSGWDGIDVLAADGRVRRVREAKGGPRHEHLQIRADDDVWAVTSDIEWQVVHYDGARWKPVRSRKQFPGKYDDNKFEALAVTSEGVWVSSWNGLWRGTGDKWQHIEAPPATDTGLLLWTYRDRLIVGGHARRYVRDGASWQELAWPQTSSVARAVGEVGLVVAPETTRATVTLAPVLAAGCTVASEPVAGAGVWELAVDGAGRVWLATDVALAVVDGDGRKLAEWTAGTLPGLSGRVIQVAVIGAGPTRLPAPQPARTWEVVGKLQTYRDKNPLAAAAVELCPWPATRSCPPGPFTRTATTAADGSFRFADVPLGDFSIVVRPPAGLEGCRSPFTAGSHSLAPVTDCPADQGRCDLGTLVHCLPFEMPPPH